MIQSIASANFEKGDFMKTRHVVMCTVSALALLLTACPSSPPSEDEGGGSGGDTGDATSGPDMGEGGDEDTGGGTGMVDAESDTGTTDPDGGDMDTGTMDTTDGGDTGPDEPLPGDLYYFTTGGSISSSSNFQLRLSVGAPSPRGKASSSNYEIQLAPVSP